MTATPEDLTTHLVDRLCSVRRNLGMEDERPVHSGLRFAEVLDSMGLVEFLAVVAEDCGTTPEAIEQCVDRQFDTIVGLAVAMHQADIGPQMTRIANSSPSRPLEPSTSKKTMWLAATSVHLPKTVQSAETINLLLQRPAGWLERHAGIRCRRIWANDDPLLAAASASREALERGGVPIEEVGALLVTSEAPPLLTGLAATLHHQLGMRPTTVALEIGNACTGFLAAWWLARSLLPQVGTVLVLAMEAPSRYLSLQPGPAGEAAALFGDAAAACVLSSQPTGTESVVVNEISLGTDGGAGRFIQVRPSKTGVVEVHLEGCALANRATGTMAQTVRELLQRNEMTLEDVCAVVAHWGNGRLPAMLARLLGLPIERVWSATERTGNLGSASLPAAWAAHAPQPQRPVVWTAVGAGLTWAAAVTGKTQSSIV